MDTTYIHLIGQPFSRLQQTMSYPPINEHSFTSRDYAHIRSLLSSVPSDTQRLFKKLCRLIKHGSIDEITEHRHGLTVTLCVCHKREQYNIEMYLSYHKWAWQFKAIHFTGKQLIPTQQRVLTYATLVFCTLLLIWLWSNDSIIHTFHGEQVIGYDDSERDQPNVTNHDEKSPPNQEDTENENVWQSQLPEFLHTYTHRQARVVENSSSMDGKEKENLEHERHTTHNRANGIQITILPGMNSQEVAELLAEKGLARSVEEIQELFITLQVQDKIRVGTYTFEETETYMDIIERLQEGQ
ncbi:hypothetical protein [Caldalkalibacillus salinus]|uniref:hypothetical protein n=1 Tax=Caldalkalibacillus salinus TaxID=2803787 RepID=UPI001920679C|nr:hypothetical protein [Caldalkalibacillus salinus]